MLIRFIKGKLPWEDLKLFSTFRFKKSNYDQFAKMVSELSVEELCIGCPSINFIIKVFIFILFRRIFTYFEIL